MSPRPFTLWFTGLSGAGKTTLARKLERVLRERGYHPHVIDGDEIRKKISRDLGFSKKDIRENQRRILLYAKMKLKRHDAIITSTISPHRASRARARKALPTFIEIYCYSPHRVRAARDPKGLYKKLRAGKIKNFIGTAIAYEPPLRPEIRINTHRETPHESVARILKFLKRKKILLA